MGAVVVAGSSVKHYVKTDDLVVLAETSFKDLETKGDVTAWMDLMRTCRQPQIMWKIDYIEPGKHLSKINDLLRRSEDILYKSRDSIDLKEGYTADINQQAAFNTIRIHLHSEDGHISVALKLLEDVLMKQYDGLSLIRQSNLLFHGTLIFLCCNNLELSFHCFEKHWALLKYARPDDRVKLGLWDNQSLLEIAHWFFIKHSEDFRDFYSVRTKTSINDIWNHKKIAMLYFLEYDNSWIVSFCGRPFYEHARSLNPQLPAYEKKRSTPHNVDKVWADSEDYVYEDNVAVGMERYFFEQFNQQMSMDQNFIDLDKTNDYLYSYYHYQTDYVEDINGKIRLIEFLKSHISLDKFTTILEGGTGVDSLPGLRGKDYLGINISSKVCSILDDKSIPHKQGCCSLFLQETDQTFDLCFVYDLLNHLTSNRLRIFLENCSKKCQYLAATVDTYDDMRSEIVSKKLSIKSVNLHPTIMTIEEWTEYLVPYFNCTLQQDGRWIHIFGKQI